MEKLNRRELQYGEIYVYKWDGGSKSAIILYTDKPDKTPTVYLYDEMHDPIFKKANNFSLGYDFYEATPQQKEWLKACMKKGTYIPEAEVKLEILTQYEIY